MQSSQLLTHSHPVPRAPARVVLLGGTGFIGSQVTLALREAGVETCALSSSEFNLNSSEAREKLIDTLRPSDSIVLLAALKPGRNHDEVAFLANITMATNLCYAVRVRGAAHLVYVSSDSVYPFDSESVNESTLPSATSLYSLMHLAREMLLCNLVPVPAAILRVAQVYGSGDPHNAYGPNRMVRSALQERRITLFGSGEETRDHIHVADVARLVTSILSFGSNGLMNVATGRSLSFLALAEMVRNVCGDGVSIEHEPRKMPVHHRQFDVSLLSAAFPSEFIRLEAGIAAMAEDMRRNNLTGGDLGKRADDLSLAGDQVNLGNILPPSSFGQGRARG